MRAKLATRLNQWTKSDTHHHSSDLIWLVAGLMAFLAISLWGCAQQDTPAAAPQGGGNPGMTQKHSRTVIVSAARPFHFKG